MRISRLRTSGFTLIELLVGMTVFSIGLTGIYALLQTTIGQSSYSRDEMIATGLLREQLELIQNLRDTNLSNYLAWDSAFIDQSNATKLYSGAFIIENSYSTGMLDISTGGVMRASPIYIKPLVDTLPTDPAAIWQQTRLNLDSNGRYTHDLQSQSGTAFASYIILSPLQVEGKMVGTADTQTGGWIVDARVIVKGRSYTQYDAKTMITNWLR